MSKIYLVEGMTCGGCVTALSNAFKSIKDSIEIEVDLETKKVTVNGFDDEAQIIETIEDAGFDYLGKAS